MTKKSAVAKKVAAKKSARGGQNRFVPTDEQRALVHGLAGYGAPHEHIARRIGCDPKTLRKHFRDELDMGTDDANAQVAGTLFAKAIGGDTASCIFWLKARAKWSERSSIEVSGADGAALPAPVIIIQADEEPSGE